MVEVPAVTLVAKPGEPDTLPTVAIAVDELHFTEVVMS
jgi:hypothetical protein